MSEKREERLKAFVSVVPSPAMQAKIASWQSMMQDVALWMDNEIPYCREQSLAFTALEEASMWAVKAFTHHEPL